MKFFTYDKINAKLSLNKDEILLVKEFATLINKSRSKYKNDRLAFKEFTYIYLFFDWESPFFNFMEQDRHLSALDSSGLTEEEFGDPDFRAACRKYDEIQNSGLSIRLLRAAMASVETVIHYLQNVDVSERDPATNKPIVKTKDLIAEIKGCKDLIISLQSLEKQVKQDLEEESTLRGDVEEGFFD
jgi:hypothetical protein